MWIRDGWSVFFGLVSVTMFVTLVAPAAFGLQNFTQWGGMYDDHWCNVDLYSADPKAKGVQHVMVTAGGDGRRVYSAPAHNRMTCTVWAHTLCGTKTAAGWTVEWASPLLQSQKYLGTRNLCDLELPPETADWFFLVPKDGEKK
jgi:hypothetical protein